MSNLLKTILLVLVPLVVIIGASSMYTVDPTEQVVITQFGKPVGDAITEPGLKFKKPFVHKVNRLEKRILEWDGATIEMATQQDMLYIQVNTFARWRISDPELYLQRLREESTAISRLDNIIGSETRNVVARHPLSEIVRSDKDRETPSDVIDEAIAEEISDLLTIRRGRPELERDILNEAKPKLAPLGIELIDVRVKRVNYNEDVSQAVFRRMISEREKIASLFLSEGQGEAARIRGRMQRDLRQIESEAYQEVQEIRGKADAAATGIFATAYDQNDASRGFYHFTKGMETLEDVLDTETTAVLSTDNELFRYLKHSDLPAARPSEIEEQLRESQETISLPQVEEVDNP